jgi:flavodoxin
MKKSLIAFYSRKGSNYAGSRIVNLPVGNTAVIAAKLKTLTGGTLFEIETIKKYPDDYTETTEISKVELKNKARPELKAKVDNMDQYDVIYLGYPNWWSTMPMAVFTFLESYDFAGKTIVPFCTHEGSGMGHSEKDIQTACPHSTVLHGLAIRGSFVAGADEDLKKWLINLKLV